MEVYDRTDASSGTTRMTTYTNAETDYPDFVTATGYGTGDGLCGWNCRHSFKPWAEGLRNPYRDDNGNLILGDGQELTPEQNAEIYRNQQRQRAMERGIRKTKRELDIKREQLRQVGNTDSELRAELERDRDRIEARLVRQNGAYNDFCREHELQPQYERTRLAGEIWRATGR